MRICFSAGAMLIKEVTLQCTHLAKHQIMRLITAADPNHLDPDPITTASFVSSWLHDIQCQVAMVFMMARLLRDGGSTAAGPVH